MIRKVEDRFHQHVEVRAPSRNTISDTGVSESTCYRVRESASSGHPSREERDACINTERSLSRVALNLQHRRNAPSVLGCKASGLLLDPVQHVGIKHGKQATEVEWAEDRHSIEKNEVLIL